MNSSVQEHPGPTTPTVTSARRPTWEQAEGSLLPLGATWMEAERAFNFAVHAEHAESVTLLLYTAADFVNPFLYYRFDFLRNKSGPIWHCRVPLSDIGEAGGTGNTLNFGRGHVRKMVMDSLRYWKREMHIDGFRFDLASVFSCNEDGSLNWGHAPIFADIAADPELSKLRLIAEPWDTGAYQLGRGFPGITWLQWNGRFRDDVRRLIKGDSGMVPEVMRQV